MPTGPEAINALRQAATSGGEATNFYRRVGDGRSAEVTAGSIALALDAMARLKAQFVEDGIVHRGVKDAANSLTEGDDRLATARDQVVAAVGPDSPMAATPSGIMQEVTAPGFALALEVMEDGDTVFHHLSEAFAAAERMGIHFGQVITAGNTAVVACEQFRQDVTAAADGMQAS